MAFDPEMDKVLKHWESEETGLVVAIHQYGAGEPKLQFGPRMITKKDGNKSQVKAGRLTIEDLLWFYDIIDEVKDELTSLSKPE